MRPVSRARATVSVSSCSAAAPAASAATRAIGAVGLRERAGEGDGGGMFRARNVEGVAGNEGQAAAGHQAVSFSGVGLGRPRRSLELVAAPGGEEQLLEGGVGRVEGLAAAGVGLAVEVAVVGLVDAAGLLAGLADERGEVLAEGREGAAEVGLHQRRELGLLAGVVAGDDGAHRVPFEADLRAAEGAGGHVLAVLDRLEGRVQHVEEAARRVELEEGGAERHEQDVGGGQAVDRQVAEGRGGIEDDEVVGVEDAVALEGAARAPPRASSRAGTCARPGSGTRPSRGSAGRRSGRCSASGSCG